MHFEGRDYRWSKHQQFLKSSTCRRAPQAPIELALASYEPRDRLLLAEHGWRVRPAEEVSRELDAYRDYIVGFGGRGLGRQGAERPLPQRLVQRAQRHLPRRRAARDPAGHRVRNALPTGEGLFAFNDLEEAVEAVRSVQADPARHRRAAREIAREYLSHEVVLGDMLDHVGLSRPRPGRHRPSPRSPAPAQFPAELSLEVRSRRPLSSARKPSSTSSTVPCPAVTPWSPPYEVSVVMPVLDNLPCTRLALEACSRTRTSSAYELVVVDNASGDRDPGVS